MTHNKKQRPSPIVTYLPRPTFSPGLSEREQQAIQVIADRDQRIASLEFSLKEIRRILKEEPTEANTALRIAEAAFPEGDE